MSGLPEKKPLTEVSLLPYDVIFKILLLLPAKDLLRLTLVCKTWLTLIHSSNFVQTHINQCKTVLTFLEHIPKWRPNAFTIDSKNTQFTLFEPTSSKTFKLQISFMEFEGRNARITDPNICGFSDILATCNGLVLATNKTGSLVILNPTTRKILKLKSGTLVPHSQQQSYGLVYCHHSQEYTAVHLFRDNSGHPDCEILSLTTKSWRGSNMPPFGLFKDFNHKPVSVSGVLYWLPGSHNINYFVSMDLKTETFVRKALPVNTSGMNDRLVENSGFLSFVAHLTVYRIQLWTLKRNEGGDDWLKHYMVNLDYDISRLVPIFVSKNGRHLIFKQSKHAIYEYDMEDEEMEQVSVDRDFVFNCKMVFPLMNTLASWANSGTMW